MDDRVIGDGERGAGLSGGGPRPGPRPEQGNATRGETRLPTIEAPLLKVRDLKTYFFQDDGTVKAVDGASFDVFSGKTLGIVGESGCGKSVTARSIMRIVDRPGRIVGGEILLRREPGAGSGEVDLAQLKADGAQMRAINGGDIGLIFQEPMTSFSPVHTVGNQIVEAIRLHQKMSKKAARDRAIELLRLVGVPRAEGRVDEFAHQLSGGLRQRAMIAMALAADPRLLIADEPTTALDVTTQSQILNLLVDLQERNGMAIMLITHDLGVIAETADDVVVMYLGRVVEEGPVDDIFHAPKHPYTRALLRSIPSVDSPPRRKLPTISGSIPHPYNRPPGCPFHTRCPDVMPGLCNVVEPPLVSVAAGQLAACFLYPEVRAASNAPSSATVAGAMPGQPAPAALGTL
ncbi:MAG: ABC transporter ATP-binding protein [Chloroflexota bacterium]|nr:ABC transporter ATP-binding protein [Chloroflexota bacterium]